ncbi:hypothetical protein RND81_10G007700 [Saponaria officinalis]|uniref:F-box domain-containing protein n=1 Tax=Saponaria officinalis TaxID=3572 RepID=A0AAW1HYV0_SAPOF
MSIDPEWKMIKPEEGHIEKWILRRAFDNEELTYLPKVTDKMIEKAAHIFPHNTPTTKEAYYYRMVFVKFFPQNSARLTVRGGPSVACSRTKAVEWDQAWSKNLDPSGRAAFEPCSYVYTSSQNDIRVRGRSMDWKLKTCSRKKLLNANADRLTSLPDELLCRILSMLSTKDAAATLVLSKHVVPARLNVWISYPLAHAGLRELDLSFHVRRPYQCKLPPSLFARQSLEVLRLSSNLEINDAKIPLISLPNLKLLYLTSFVFKDDNFVTRLVSSCPVLEDLTIECCSWKIGDRVSISSHSLRSLVLLVRKVDHHRCRTSDLLLLDTPHLQYLDYLGYVAARYSIAPMNALVKASVDIIDKDTRFLTELSLVRAMPNVSDLSLLRSLVEKIYFTGELRDKLPVFRDLRTLKLDCLYYGRWDIVLLFILHRSPSLETLVFVEGLFLFELCGSTFVEEAALEADSWRTAHPIPSCCLTHLKRVVIDCCFRTARELNIIKFLLAKSSVLEELVIRLATFYNPSDYDHLPTIDQFENTVKDLPRASSSCLITLQR